VSCLLLLVCSRHETHETLDHGSIRNRLTALKRDREKYIKPSDVNALYQAVVKQGPYFTPCFGHSHDTHSPVTRLNDVRDDNTTYNNRVDTTLADVFSLLSLCYLTLGKTKECPAVYSQLASMRVSINNPFPGQT